MCFGITYFPLSRELKDCGCDGDLLEKQLRDRLVTGLIYSQLKIDFREKLQLAKMNTYIVSSSPNQ